MTKGSRVCRRIASRKFRPAPYRFPSRHHKTMEKKCSKVLDKKDWVDVTCSVCMDYPHNAVLLLCSSHDKGCHPYMCGTSYRYSNCFDQYKKAYTKVITSNNEQFLHGSISNPILIPDFNGPSEKCEVTELACPLCRGQVKGWTVVQPARDYLNLKKRSCMQDSCSFVGNYRELRKHVRTDHPSARPLEVDPVLEQKWRRLERERERDDVISTIRSTMPGAMVFGDYVVEGNHYDFDSDDENEAIGADVAQQNGGFEMGFESNLANVFFLLHAFEQSGHVDLRGRPRQEIGNSWPSDDSAIGVRHTSPVVGINSSDQDNNSSSDADHIGGMSLVNRLHRHGRVLLGRSGRRRRHRELNEGQTES